MKSGRNWINNKVNAQKSEGNKRKRKPQNIKFPEYNQNMTIYTLKILYKKAILWSLRQWKISSYKKDPKTTENQREKGKMVKLKMTF